MLWTPAVINHAWLWSLRRQMDGSVDKEANKEWSDKNAACAMSEGGSLAWALRIRSLHGFPLSPLRNASATTPGAIAVTAAALCAASMARIVANSRRRAAT